MVHFTASDSMSESGSLCTDWARYHAEAVRNGIDPVRAAFPVLSDEAFSARRKKDTRLYLYFRRNIGLALCARTDSCIAAVLVDAEGCLLDIMGSEAVRGALARDGLHPGIRLSPEETGPDAISVGTREAKNCSSVGGENFNRVLQKYALYFSHIAMQRLDPPYEVRNYGGVAVIVPAERANPEFIVTSAIMAHDMLLNAHYSERTYRRYELTGLGVISADTNMVRGDVTATHCNQTLFDMLDIPYMDMRGKPLAQLIDPLPENEEFWTVLSGARRVTDYEISLKTLGKENTCIITTDTFDQPMLNIKGTNFFVSTPRYLSAQVSEKMGNNAVRSFENIVGTSPAFKAAVQRAKLTANTDSNIMLWGESGVGKDVFAQAIHNTGRRKGKPFIAVNCGALPRDLIASELFGYDSGAFTGAKRQGNIGKFELADSGTLFLDEIGELPLDLQATLLRVVEQKRFIRLGGTKEITVDVKIISATNANLPEMIEQKRFREDLFYRLSTIQLDIPPLRARGEDIALLARHFIRTISARIGRTEIMELSDEAQALLMSLPWRGNVRELQNLIESIVQLYPEPQVRPEHIWGNIRMQGGGEAPNPPSVPVLPDSPAPKNVKVRSQRGKRIGLTQEQIMLALEECGGNRSDAAKLLGIARRTLYRYIELLGL